MSERVSLRGFARRQGVSPQAVSKAVKAGRLSRSVGRDAAGRPVITNPELAAQEWRTRAARPRTAGKPASPRASRCQTLSDVQKAIAVQRERRLRLENDLREGKLLPAEQVTLAQQTIASAVKTQLLAVPRRCCLAGLPREHEELLRREIVSALRELADVKTFGALEAKT